MIALLSELGGELCCQTGVSVSRVYFNAGLLANIVRLYAAAELPCDSDPCLIFPPTSNFSSGYLRWSTRLGLFPVFISMTSYQTAAARNKTNLTANLSVAIILLDVAVFWAMRFCSVFGISIDSFRIAGGHSGGHHCHVDDQRQAWRG